MRLFLICAQSLLVTAKPVLYSKDKRLSTVPEDKNDVKKTKELVVRWCLAPVKTCNIADRRFDFYSHFDWLAGPAFYRCHGDKIAHYLLRRKKGSQNGWLCRVTDATH